MAFAAAAGLAVQVASSISGGIAANKAARAEAKALRAAGKVEAADRRRQTSRLLARQTVAFAASGIDVGTGTPLQVLADTVAEEELAALRIESGRAAQSEAARFQGRQAQTQGFASAAGTVLSGISSAVKLGRSGGGGGQPSQVSPGGR